MRWECFIVKIIQNIGLQGLYPKRKPIISIKHRDYKIYPYLLEGLKINKANQVWASDITYIDREQSRYHFALKLSYAKLMLCYVKII